MKLSVLLSFSLLTIFGLYRPAYGADPKGHLVVVGGGSTTPAIVKKTLELAGGPAAIVVVIAQASSLKDAGESSVVMWRAAGATSVSNLNLNDLPSAIKAVGKATLIWMPGGDQNRLMAALANTGIPEIIRQRYEQGATIGGTSAGAAVISRLMLTGEADLQGIASGKTKTATGLGLWPEVIVDQHFLKRQRQNRLISIVLDHPDLVGVGIDEATAVVVSGHVFEVIGKSCVVVFDARGATRVKSADGEPEAALNIKMHVLRDGMKLDLE